MIAKGPLRESKQSLAMTKNQSLHLKETCKPGKFPTKQPVKKENMPQSDVRTERAVEKVAKSPLNPKRQVPSRSIKVESRIKAPLSFMTEVKQQLLPCKDCGRTFNEPALKRHEKICKKIFINKRKEFNSAKQRFESKDQLNLYKKNKDKYEQKHQNKKINAMPIWKQQSMAFRLAMKQVRGSEKTQQEMQYLQKQKKLIKSSMFKCKFCGRSFNQQSGKRHESFCAQKAKDMSSKLKRK